jgi:hypothetical protein
MGWFTKPITVATAERETPQRTLATIEREFRAAEREFIEACRRVSAHNAKQKDIRTANFNGDVCTLLNAASHDPLLQQLESARARAQRRRNELLQQRADVMKTLGLIR